MSHLSTLALHQYRLGELPAEEIGRAETHLAACERCRRRLEAQKSAREAFAAEPLPPAIAALSQPANRPFARWLLWSVPLLVAAIALFTVLMRPHEPEDAGIRTKGTLPDVEVWVKGESGKHALRPDEVLGEGSVVQVLYNAHGAHHAVLAGRDGTGKVEVYGELPVADTLVPAPFGLTLDDAPGPQELFVVTGDREITVRDVEDAVNGSGGSRDLQVRSVEVRKVGGEGVPR